MASSMKGKNGSGDGGTDAPAAIDVVDYAGARAREMEAMATVSRRVWGNNKAMQTLPRHMRRRAASHNVKRLPRRLRDKGRREMAQSGTPTNTKRPSRRHRRRPGNLLEEYSRRARQNVWLETHIWHAKRFHMATQWGYRIPLHPNDKGVRAAYRGAARYCIMRDISYMCCLELEGPQSDITQGLSRLCSSETGPTPAAARCISGTREGEALFYRHDQYPNGTLGPVKFLWKPCPDSESADRHLWMWVHPACYDDIVDELKIVFNLKQEGKIETQSAVIDSATAVTEAQAKSGKDIDQTKCADTENNGNTKSVDDTRPSSSESVRYSNGQITLRSLKDLLCRFNLCGPLSHSILLDLLKIADVGVVPQSEEDIDNGNLQQMDTENDTANISEPQSEEKNKWWNTYFSDPGPSSAHRLQTSLWEELRGLQSAGELTDSVVLGLTVRDPRIFLPSKKMRVADDPSSVSEMTLEAVKTWPSGVATSPIWDHHVRRQVKTSKMSEQQMNKLRAQHLVPGTQLELGEEESRIPVLLIQHPGPRPRSGRPQQTSSQAGVPLGWAAGWDLVLPAAWGMAFWVGLVYRGARACGLKESLSTATEMGQLHFPEGFPDTPTGQQIETEQRTALEGKYKRMPPAKRPNYIKLGSVAPFHYPWTQLITDWVSPQTGARGIEETAATEPAADKVSSGDIVVLRNRRLLQQLDEVCSGQYNRRRSKVPKTSTGHHSVHGGLGEKKEAVLRTCSLNGASLVAVRLRALQRGVLETFSVICIPTEDDLKALQQNGQHGGPLEPHHNDEEQKEKRTEAKDQVKKTKGLCEDIIDVRSYSSRSTIGFVKQGGYHLCDGRGAGIGFVVVEGLRSLLQGKCTDNSSTTALVRSPRSNQYRYAMLSILI